MSERTIVIYPRQDGKKLEIIKAIIEDIKAVTKKHNVNIAIYPDIPDSAFMMIAIGGDGTFINAAHIAYEHDIPIAGVNAGDLGFLTEIKMEEVTETVEKYILMKELIYQERIIMKAWVERDGQQFFSNKILNELYLTRLPNDSMLSFELTYNNCSLPSFKADGVIVATPTGSTAYNLSLNGPVLFPTVHSIIINAMAPHSLTHRPMVLPSCVGPLEIYLKEANQAVFAVDGRRAVPVRQGDKIIIRESKRDLKFIPSGNRNFFDILSEKFHWGKRS